jgi:NAD(P)-dependent dehydrogenase (short-subunit alcohol dehydrogenase family)
MEVEGKVAIVTGAGGGIGGAISRALAAAGAKVVVADLDGAAALATAAEIETAQPGAAVGVEADVADRAAIEGLLRTAEETFGPLDLYFSPTPG